jgi:hypothetical protein
MTTAPESTIRFPYAGSWSRPLVLLGCHTVFGVLAFGLAGWTVLVGLASEGRWWVVPSILMFGAATLYLFLLSVTVLSIAIWLVVARVVGWSAVQVTDSAVWLSEPFAWSSRFIPFDSVLWVKHEQSPDGVSFVRIVYGPGLGSGCVRADDIRPADFDAFFALLAERCPAAFTPDPPPGWQPPRK